MILGREKPKTKGKLDLFSGSEKEDKGSGLHSTRKGKHVTF